MKNKTFKWNEYMQLRKCIIVFNISGVLKAFINGEEAGVDKEVKTMSFLNSNTQQLRTDCRYSYISDFAIWWEKLTQKQISHLYNNG